MHWIDWTIVGLLLALLTGAALYTQQYTRSVADFLAANRCAGRYLLSISQGVAGVGAISLVAGFELFYNAGLTGAWWRLLFTAVNAVLFLTGWVIYRLRETRALTLAQFLEMRYSRRFRVFAGIIAWLSGIINFGIFPAVGARFFLYFCGFPDNTFTFATLMIIMLSFALFFTFLGGQVAVMVTDFIQGVFCNGMFVIIPLVVLGIFTWPRIVDVLSAAPADNSLVHPFHTQRAQDFNIWFYLVFAFSNFYNGGVWQGSQAYNVSALNAHEARMGRILSGWRILAVDLFMMILPLCALTFMMHPDFAERAAQARQVLADIVNPQIQEQVATTVPTRFFLPVGMMGGLAAVMLAAFISTHDTYLHSWGSIFIQDVVLPLRRKPLSPRQHIRLLRLSIFGVAVFIFCFSLIFRQTEYIFMFFQITGAIFLGGAGAVVIGGLYWKKGPTAGAWSAMFTGSSLAVIGVIIRQIHQSYPDVLARVPLIGSGLELVASQNGAILGFYASAIAICVYVIVSLATCRHDYNLARLLHRGPYAVEDLEKTKAKLPVTGLRALIGMGSEFNFRDKLIYLASIGWMLLLAAVFVLGTLYNLMIDVPNESWLVFWKCYLWLMIVLSAVTTVWFTIGGLFDLRRMFHMLGTLRRNDSDDGTVLQEDAPLSDSEQTST